MPVVEVQRADDPRLDDFRDLAVADRRPDRPGGRGLVVAEGTVVVRRLLGSPYPLRAVLGVAAKVEELADDLVGCPAPCYVTSAEVMAAAVGFHLNRGVLATADRPAVPWSASVLTASARSLAVLEGVNDPENLGGIFRAAAALGVDAVLLGARCGDPLYRRSVRVSMGHVLRVPFAPLPRWPDGLADLRAAGFRVAALTPAAGAVPLAEAGLGTGRVAVLLGAEGPGLTAAAVGAADVAVRIPMAPGVDSLNVATAAAVAFATTGRISA